jgi:hypothetical protein
VRLGTVVIAQTEVTASMADVPWLGVVATPQEKVAQVVPQPARTEESASEPSVENGVVGQVSVPEPPTLATTGQTVLGEASPRERLASPGSGEGHPRL